LDAVDAIYLHGSRSPLRTKKPNDESDWDIVVITKVYKLTLALPRVSHKLHADLLIVHESTFEKWKNANSKAVEIWPTDNYEVLNNEST